MLKLIRLADIKELLPLLDRETITMSRFAELLNERANLALKQNPGLLNPNKPNSVSPANNPDGQENF